MHKDALQLSMGACVCMHVSVHVCSHTHASTHPHIHTHMHAHASTIYTCIHNMYKHPHIYTCTINFPNRGDSLVVPKGGVSACSWMDRKLVMVMSSNTQPLAKGLVLWRQKDHISTPISCPESIVLYNKYMGVVDRGDQLRG